MLSIKKILPILFLAVVARSQGVWQQMLPPGPTTNQMASVHFTDELTGISVGEQGTILKTEDGGETWRIIEIPWLAYLLDIHFPSADVGYIVGQNGIILKTADAGETWSLQNSGFSNNLHRVRFLNESEGWIIGESGLILYTEDGGLNWQQQISNTSKDLLGISLIDDYMVCIVGKDEILLRSEDGGQNWISQTIHGLNSNYTYNFNDVFFLDDSIGWIGGEVVDTQEGVLLTTNNSGVMWSKHNINSITFPVGSIIASFDNMFWGVKQIYFKNINSGIFITGISNDNYYYSLPLFTNNGGIDWKGKQESFNSWQGYIQPSRLFPITETKVILTGYRGEFRFSDNGGNSWYFPNKNCRDFKNVTHGNSGKLFVRQVYLEDVWDTYPDRWKHSLDYGKTWIKITPRLFDKNNDEVYFKSFPKIPTNIDDKLWTLYYPNGFWKLGEIYRSNDWGVTWHWQSDSVHSDLYNAVFLSQDTLLNYNLVQRGSEPDTWSALEIIFSYDKGKTIEAYTFNELWNDIVQSTEYSYNNRFISDHFFFDGLTGFIVGSEGNIIKTENTGKSWRSINSGVADHLWDVFFLDRSTGFVVGNFGRVLKSKDGGETWHKTDSGTQGHIFSIDFKNNQDGWIGTENGLRYTTDCGETWSAIPLRYQQGHITKVYFDDEGTGYAFNYLNSTIQTRVYGEFNKYPKSYNSLLCWKESGVFVNQDIKPVPITDNFSLNQNYPNPFNNTTVINYQLLKSGKIDLSIYSILGQKITSLVSRSQSAGIYNIGWNVTGYASGIYIYQLNYNGQVKSRKMLKLK